MEKISSDMIQSNDEEMKKHQLKYILIIKNKLSDLHFEKIFTLIKNYKIDIESILDTLKKEYIKLEYIFNEKSKYILYEIIKFMKDYNLSEKDVKEIIKKIKNSSEYEKEKRILDFINFIGKEKIDQKKKNLKDIIVKDKDINENKNEDIIYSWENKLIFSYVYSTKKPKCLDFIEKINKKLIFHDYNLDRSKNMLEYFNIVLFEENFDQYEIIETMMDIIFSYKIEDINKVNFKINNYIEKNNEKFVKIKDNILIEFYLKNCKITKS